MIIFSSSCFCQLQHTIVVNPRKVLCFSMPLSWVWTRKIYPMQIAWALRENKGTQGVSQRQLDVFITCGRCVHLTSGLCKKWQNDNNNLSRRVPVRNELTKALIEEQSCGFVGWGGGRSSFNFLWCLYVKFTCNTLLGLSTYTWLNYFIHQTSRLYICTAAVYYIFNYGVPLCTHFVPTPPAQTRPAPPLPPQTLPSPSLNLKHCIEQKIHFYR